MSASSAIVTATQGQDILWTSATGTQFQFALPVGDTSIHIGVTNPQSNNEQYDFTLRNPQSCFFSKPTGGDFGTCPSTGYITAGDSCLFTCPTTLTLTPSNLMVCGQSGVFNQVATCEPCSTLSIAHGTVTITGGRAKALVGDTATFTCDNGYGRNTGLPSWTCGTGSLWPTASLPTCVRMIDSISTDCGALVPPFSADIHTYTVAPAYYYQTCTFNGVPLNNAILGASMTPTYVSGSSVWTSNSQDGYKFNMKASTYKFTIAVISITDGLGSADPLLQYTVTITDPFDISAVSISGQTISPAYVPTIRVYSITPSSYVNQVTVNLVWGSASATIGASRGSTYTTGVTNFLYSVTNANTGSFVFDSLVYGPNPFTIAVTGLFTDDLQTYVFTINNAHAITNIVFDCPSSSLDNPWAFGRLTYKLTLTQIRDSCDAIVTSSGNAIVSASGGDASWTNQNGNRFTFHIVAGQQMTLTIGVITPANPAETYVFTIPAVVLVTINYQIMPIMVHVLLSGILLPILHASSNVRLVTSARLRPNYDVLVRHSIRLNFVGVVQHPLLLMELPPSILVTTLVYLVMW